MTSKFLATRTGRIRTGRSIARPRPLAQLKRQTKGSADAYAKSDAKGDLVDGNANPDAKGNPNTDAEGKEARSRPVFIGGGWGV